MRRELNFQSEPVGISIDDFFQMHLGHCHGSPAKISVGIDDEADQEHRETSLLIAIEDQGHVAHLGLRREDAMALRDLLTTALNTPVEELPIL